MKYSCRRKRYFAWVICIILLFGLFANSFACAERKKVRLGYVNQAGFEEGGEGEYKKGFGYEYLQKIAMYTDWEYEYVYGSFSEMIVMLQNGEIELLGNVTWMEEREGTMLFGRYPEGSETFYLFASTNRREFVDAEDAILNGKRVGVASNTYQSKLVREWAAQNGIEFEIIEYNGNDAMFAALEQKQIDLAVTTDIGETGNYIPVRVIGTQDYYFAVANGRPDLLEELNAAQEAILLEDPNYNQIIESRYASRTVSKYVLNQNERAWLQAHNNVIRIGYVDDMMPYSDQTDEGRVTGYVAAVIDRMSVRYGIKVEAVCYSSFEDMYMAFGNGDVDCCCPAFGDLYISEQRGIAQTEAFASTQLSIVYSSARVHTGTIAVSPDNLIYMDEARALYPDAEFKQYESIEDCIAAIANGEAESMLIPASMVVQLRSVSGFSELNCTDVNKTIEICLITRRGESVLMSILNKAIILSADALRSSAYVSGTTRSESKGLLGGLLPNFGTADIILLIVIVLLVIFLHLKRTAHRKAFADNAQLNRENAELKEALAEATRISNSKTRFLTGVSRDVRIPMTTILGNAEILKKEKQLSNAGANCVRQIENTGRFLVEVINGVLDMARIESGDITLDESLIDLCGDGASKLEVYRAEIERKHINFSNELDVIHRYVFGDSARMQLVMQNLLGNAIAYTAEGGSIRLVTREISSDRIGYGMYQTDITDNGVGIRPEDIPYLFEAPTADEEKAGVRPNGHGLGLHMVKMLVDKLGGTVEVESEVGKGTSFRVTLPMRIAEDPESFISAHTGEYRAEIDLSGKRILLAEDNDLNAEIAIAILEDVGLKVDRVADGVECVDRIAKAEPDMYDLILMDVGMPQLDGYGATKRIRRLSDKEKAKIPIVAITADAGKKAKETALAAGMNDHITKPIDFGILMACLAKYLK